MPERSPLYLTTPIFYANAAPHVGQVESGIPRARFSFPSRQACAQSSCAGSHERTFPCASFTGFCSS